MTEFVLTMTGFVFNMTGFVLNMTVFIQNMTGFDYDESNGMAYMTVSTVSHINDDNQIKKKWVKHTQTN